MNVIYMGADQLAGHAWLVIGDVIYAADEQAADRARKALTQLGARSEP